MSRMTTGQHLQEFRLELAKSAVISDDFRNWLEAQMITMASIAHKQGYTAGVRDERKARKRKEGGKTNGKK